MAVYVIAFPSSYFFLFLSICYKGGGVSRNAWRRHPSHPLLHGKPRRRVQGDRKKGEGDVHGQNVPLSTSVDTPSKINTSIILKVAGCLESRMERTEEAFAGFPAMEPLVEHPVKKERSRKLSDGYRNSYVYFHRDSRLGAEHDGAKGRPVLLEGRRQTVWGRRRERPGR